MALEVSPTELHRISPDEYRRLAEAGVLDEDARVELIRGLILDMSPKTPAHENVIAWLTRRLVSSVDEHRAEVRVGAPLTIADSEPEPDLAVVELTAARPHHPATALLVIEVAVSSLRRDLHDKPPIYASAAVPEYWVVDLAGRRVVVHRRPHVDAYEQVEVVSAQGSLEARSIGSGVVSVTELLAAADR